MKYKVIFEIRGFFIWEGIRLKMRHHASDESAICNISRIKLFGESEYNNGVGQPLREFPRNETWEKSSHFDGK